MPNVDELRRVLDETNHGVVCAIEAQLEGLPPQDQFVYLANVAKTNRANWSGGADSPANIVETYRREYAVHKLNRLAQDSALELIKKD